MISIITAIHNQISVNELFLKSLQKYTHNQFELIIIDNCSSDGSAKYFENNGAKVIRNTKNYSYPYCQNQGIKIAKGEYLAFLNNDIILSPDWDKHFIEAIEKHDLDIISPCGVERMESPKATRKALNRWRLIKNMIYLFGVKKWVLKLTHKLRYGNWEAFCKKRFQKNKNNLIEGIVGHTVFMKKTALDKIGNWDERIQAADFDLFARTKKRNLEVGDIKPIFTHLGVYIHHFGRLTVKSNYPKFEDFDNLIDVKEKWGEDQINEYRKDYYKSI